MYRLMVGLSCFLGCFACLAPAEVPKRLSEEELAKELAVVQSYLNLDPDLLDRADKRGLWQKADSATTKVIRDVGGLEQDSPVRLKAVALARKFSAIPEYAAAQQLLDKNKRLPVVHNQAHMRLNYSWGVLRETKLLRDGMRLEEVVGLLGEPTTTTPECAEWYYMSEMHVNPALYYWRKDSNGRKKGQLEFASK